MCKYHIYDPYKSAFVIRQNFGTMEDIPPTDQAISEGIEFSSMSNCAFMFLLAPLPKGGHVPLLYLTWAIFRQKFLMFNKCS